MNLTHELFIACGFKLKYIPQYNYYYHEDLDIGIKVETDGKYNRYCDGNKREDIVTTLSDLIKIIAEEVEQRFYEANLL